MEEISTSFRKSILKENEEYTNDGGIYSQDKNEIYYFSIIDILTVYNYKKVLEYIFKSIRYLSHNMSCIPPESYQNRFMKYMKEILITNNNKTKKIIEDSPPKQTKVEIINTNISKKNKSNDSDIEEINDSDY